MGVLLLIASGLYFYASVWRAPAALTDGSGAVPWPDGAEYLGAAVSLARDGEYRIHLAGESHPPRYPFGYSLLVAAFLRAGVETLAAPHRASQVAGLVLLVLVGGALWGRGRPVAAGLAVALLATTPAFVILSRAPLSETAGAVPVLAGLICLYAWARRGADSTPWLAAGGAALLGASVAFRTANLLFLAFLPAAVFVASRRTSRPGAVGFRARVLRMSWTSVPLALGAGLGSAPALVYNVAAFGRPWATGYGYWVPYWDASRAFRVAKVPRNLEYYWSDILSREVRFTSADLYGTGTYYGPALAGLLLLGSWWLWEKSLLPFVAAGSLYLASMLSYFATDGRLIFPAVVLAVPVAAVGLCEVGKAGGRGSTMALLAGGMLWASAVVGWPDTTGSSTTRALVTDMERRDVQRPSRLVRTAGRLALSERSLVLTDLPPPYVTATLSSGIVVAPLRGDHPFRFAPERFHFCDVERRELVERAAEEGRPVWVLAERTDVWRLRSLVPPPGGYVWEVVASVSDDAGVARLVVRDTRRPPESPEAGRIVRRFGTAGGAEVVSGAPAGEAASRAGRLDRPEPASRDDRRAAEPARRPDPCNA